MIHPSPSTTEDINLPLGWVPPEEQVPGDLTASISSGVSKTAVALPAEEIDVDTLKGFRPDVQAMRGLAVLAVVLYHAQFPLPGGFIGVDVFFVISGFVIGRLLLAQLLSTDRVPFKSFYVRRAHRLLPALGLMTALVILLAPLLAPIGAASVTSQTGINAGLFSANAFLHKATAGGYFADAAELNPLLHTWSLSVEEQFYFLIPALLFLAWKVGRRLGRPILTLRVFAVGLFAVSFGFCLLFSFVGGTDSLRGVRFAFFSPVTRAWEFAAGLALVLLPVRWLDSSRRRSIFVLSGLGLISVSMLVYSDLTLFPGIAALLPVAGTAMVIYGGTAMSGGEEVRRSGVLRPLIWLGDLSYSWYLWHWPLIVFAGAYWPTSGSIPLFLAATASLLLARLSYRSFEQRFRPRPTAQTRRALILVACCVLAPVAAAILARTLTSVIDRQADIAAFVEGREFHVDERSGCNDATAVRGSTAEDCIWGDDSATTSLVLIGDSNAGQFSEALIRAAQNHEASLRIATMSSCPFIDAIVGNAEHLGSVCRDFVLRSIEELEAHPPDAVIIANSTDGYLMRDQFTFIDPATAEEASEEAKPALFEAGLERIITRVRAAGSDVVVINVTPKPKDWSPEGCSSLAILIDSDRCLFRGYTPVAQQPYVVASRLEQRAAERSGAELWSFNAEICPANQCESQARGTLVWRDAGHISVATSEALAPVASRYLASSGW